MMALNRLIPCAILLNLAAAPSLFSAQITPPGQPLSGPGGSTYLYSATVQAGPFYSTPGNGAQGAGSASQAYYIFQPSANPAPSSLPVILFLHGYLLDQEPGSGDSPQNYIGWIRHIVKNGYTVVFPLYDQGAAPNQFAVNIQASWQSALSKLSSGGFIPPQSDGQGMLTAFVGHSMGAVEALTVAQTLNGGNAPAGLPRAIGAFTPGVGKTNLSLSFNNLNADTKLILVEGDEDTSSDLATAQAVWSSAVAALPAPNRDFLEVISDSHGSPAQLGNHWFPLTNGLNDTAAIDDRDYNVTWKLSVGLLDCTFKGTNCSYVLTHGSSQEVDMGLWSDGTAVQPLQEIP